MRILRLTMENWKNFRHFNAQLQQRVFIAGPNASGKSNLMDALKFLQDIVLDGGGLQAAVQRRGGLSKIRCLAARRYPDVVLEASIGNDIETPEWSYRLELHQDNLRRPLIRREVVHRENQKILERPDNLDKSDSERLTQTHLEQVISNKEFRPVSEFLESIRYMHIIPQLIRQPDRYDFSRKGERDSFGSDLLEQIAKTPEKTLKSRLRRINDALKVAVPQLQELALERDEIGTPHLQGRYEHWRPKGAWQTEEQFSDGTLRLMGLLWAVLEGSGPLLLEEPELSLHPAVIRHIPQMLSRVSRRHKRQILLSTHSPDLLADPGIAADEVLVLVPDPNGTRALPLIDSKESMALIEAGENVGDVALPLTAPKRAQQLSLFE